MTGNVQIQQLGGHSYSPYTGPLRSMSGMRASRDITTLYVRRFGQMDRGPYETA